MVLFESTKPETVKPTVIEIHISQGSSEVPPLLRSILKFPIESKKGLQILRTESYCLGPELLSALLESAVWG